MKVKNDHGSLWKKLISIFSRVSCAKNFSYRSFTVKEIDKIMEIGRLSINDKTNGWNADNHKIIKFVSF